MRGAMTIDRRSLVRGAVSLTGGVLVAAIGTRGQAVTAQDGAATAAASPAAGGADLAAIKTYAVEQVAKQKAATAELVPIIQRYYDLAQSAGFDYEGLWQTNQMELAPLLMVVKQMWLEASTAYEFNEGLVAGVPSLAYFDVWLDAGPSEIEDPENALDWTLTLPDGRELVKPGNIFSHITEPALYGSIEEYVGLRVDMDADGEVAFGEVLPEANILLGGFTALDNATTELQTAVGEWQPTIEDAFTALTTMIPTVNDYFEQWKRSRFVSGDAATETAFVAVSRLSDINGIFNGLAFTYEEISPLVIAEDPALSEQISAGFADLVAFVEDLFTKESSGTVFSPEQADMFGAEAQDRATQLVGLVSQAIALLGLQV